MPRTMKKINSRRLQIINEKIGVVADLHKRMLDALGAVVAVQSDRDGVLQRANDEGFPGSFQEVGGLLCNLMEETAKLKDVAEEMYELIRYTDADPATW